MNNESELPIISDDILASKNENASEPLSEMETINETEDITVETVDSSDEEDENELYKSMKQKFDLDNIGEFFFESDHLALKVNSDYQNALQCMAVLEAQRIQVLKDLDQLRFIKSEALKNPIGFVQSLQQKEDLGIPLPQRVASLPTIDWSKYNLKSGQNLVGFLNRPFRSAKADFTQGFGPSDELDVRESENKDDKTTMVRGRVFDKNKPATFNQLWTTEEQKRLEELLVLYPPEEVESKRWAKIAAELGNRTPTQVASRVQKYFIKLSRAGIPVPGRPPSTKYKVSQRLMFSRRPTSVMARNLSSLHSSTFFRHKFPTFFNLGGANDESVLSHQVPKASGSHDNGEVGDNNSAPASICGRKESEDDVNESEDEEQEDVLDEEPDDPEIREFMYLKKLKENKLQSQGLAQHIGFKCDRCNCNPIIGTRWHCIDCPPNTSTDFCNDCVDCQHESFPHTANHNMQPVKQAECSKPFLDRDYIHFMGGDYNYLDPNYMPAT